MENKNDENMSKFDGDLSYQYNSDITNLTKSEKKGSKYINKWNKWPHGIFTGLPMLLKWIGKMALRVFSSNDNVQDNLPVFQPYFIDKSICMVDSDLKATWLGHATVLVEIEGFNILCDPVFSKGIGPMPTCRRYRESPCDVENLPNLDAVVISHNHYDHMDYNSIYSISKFHENVTWLIPMGDRHNLEGMLSKTSKIQEMDWWEKFELEKNGDKMIIFFTPSQHWSNRGLLDTFKSLWGSWAFIGKHRKFWFGGDTGYCNAFKEINQKFGSFDCAAIPIGAYEPRNFLKFQHVNPEESVEIHKDIKSKISIGIHWGTFTLSEEPYMEPKAKLSDAVQKMKQDDVGNETDFFTLNHGETLCIFKDDQYKVVRGNSISPENFKDKRKESDLNSID